MKTILKYTCIFLALTIIVSCEKDPVDGEIDSIRKNTVVTPDFLDIADAEALVVINDNSNKKSGNGDPHKNGNLFKIKSNGDYVEVRFRDSNGQPFERIVYYTENGDSIENYPSLIVNEINELNDNYLLIEGAFSYLDLSDLENPQNVFYESLLLRLNDGALFNFEDKIDWYRSCRYKNRYLYTDNQGNIYYTSKFGDLNVQKLTTHEDGSITRTNILPYNQKFKEYFVDGDGNLFYKPDDLGSTFEGFKVKVADGGIIQFDRLFYNQETETTRSSMFTEFQFVWVGEDKQVNALVGVDSSSYNETYGEWDTHEMGLDRIMDFNVTDAEIQYSSRMMGLNEIVDNFRWQVDFYVYRTSFENEMIFIYGNCGQQLKTELWALDLVNKTYRKGIIPVNEGEYVDAMIHDGNEYIYLAANSKLLKISKKDFSYTNFLPENQYDLFALSVSEDDVITFNALRYSDAKIVIGQIDENGELSITKDDMEEPVSALVRIN
jgi:hypothetical protein